MTILIGKNGFMIPKMIKKLGISCEKNVEFALVFKGIRNIEKYVV